MRNGQAHQRDAFDRVQLRVRAQHLEHARNDVDLNVAVLHRANHRERLLVRVRRERDCDAVHRVRLDERGQVAGRSEEVERLISVRRSAAIAVDEADDLQSVLGMVADLVGQQARDLTRPDDDDVLDVRGVPPSHDSRDRPEQRNEQDRDRPEDDEAREVRMRQADDLRDRHEPPRADGDHLQNAEDVVDGRVVGSLLVSIVEAVHACDEHPEGEARDEECDLPARVDLIDRGIRARPARERAETRTGARRDRR